MIRWMRWILARLVSRVKRWLQYRRLRREFEKKYPKSDKNRLIKIMFYIEFTMQKEREDELAALYGTKSKTKK